MPQTLVDSNVRTYSNFEIIIPKKCGMSTGILHLILIQQVARSKQSNIKVIPFLQYVREFGIQGKQFRTIFCRRSTNINPTFVIGTYCLTLDNNT